jgi:transcriptional regulator with XRE-family HTH domain
MVAAAPIETTVGRRIAEARQAAGLTVRDLATQLGWPHTTLANYEIGRRPLTLARLAVIARALHRVPASFLVDSYEAATIVEAIADDVERCVQVRLVLDALAEPLPEPPG